jgi:hypothetical protein
VRRSKSWLNLWHGERRRNDRNVQRQRHTNSKESRRKQLLSSVFRRQLSKSNKEIKRMKFCGAKSKSSFYASERV